MALFLSSYTNKIDKKGRVSVPANYRNLLSDNNFSGVIIYPSFINKCLEACSLEHLSKMQEAIETLPDYSEERDAFETTIFGASTQLSFDNEGRILLSKIMLEGAELDEQAVFVGKGRTFEIWNPDNYQQYYSKALQVAKERRRELARTGGVTNG